MNVRFATIEDAPAIFGVLDDHKADLLDDFCNFNLMWLGERINAGEAIAIVDNDDYPVGAVWVEPTDTPIAKTIHFAVRPGYLKPFLKEKVPHTIIDLIFDHYSVDKLKAEIALRYSHKTKRFKGKTTALKMMRLLRFHQVGFWKKDTKIKGQYFDTYLYELHRKFWKRLKKAETVENVA